MAGRGLPAILAPLHIKNLQPLLIWPIVILFSPFQQAKKGKPYDTGAMPRNLLSPIWLPISILVGFGGCYEMIK